MTTTHQPPQLMPADQADRYREKADQALGKHNQYDNHLPLATPNAVLAVSQELAVVSETLTLVDGNLERIAGVLEERERAVRMPEPDFTESELVVVRGEISRTDTKSSILLASVAIVAGPLAEKADTLLRQPWWVAVVGLVASVLAGVSTWLLLDVVLPRMKGITNANFIYYSQCTADELDEALGTGANRRAELAVLSAIAKAKFECLGRAGVLLKVSGLLFALTAGLAIAF
ncbi:Pycsar system effector family protein [Streptomyces sp. IBSBF 2950]|uniref:Pycsar system effector family protein n=1 Tax=Streptomyces sp. IBSBF 2950 TaxID=2903528 RepID=UPI002FDC426D